MAPHLKIPSEQLRALCASHRIRKLALFGSVLREDFSPESDLDILVEFEPEARATYFDLARVESDLEKLLPGGRKLDLLTPGSLHPRIRDRILASQEVLYES